MHCDLLWRTHPGLRVGQWSDWYRGAISPGLRDRLALTCRLFLEDYSFHHACSAEGTHLPMKILARTQAFAYQKWTAARNATAAYRADGWLLPVAGGLVGGDSGVGFGFASPGAPH